MACLEHSCNACGHMWFSNSKEKCPACGCENVHTWYDEANDHDQPDDHEGGDE